MNGRANLCCGVLALLAAAGSSARAVAEEAQVTVEVVDVAGGRAYVRPGQAAGLRRGDIVRLNGRKYVLSAVSRESAVIDAPARAIKRGARGRVQVSPQPAGAVKRLPNVTALAAFRGQWPAPVVPARRQTVKKVPLGSSLDARPTRVELSARGAALLPLSAADPHAYGELRARVRAEPFRDLPLRADVDAAVQRWLGSSLSEAARASRPWLRVRALELAYGDRAGLEGGIGRLRYASRTGGMLDGARVQAPLVDGLTLGAFGGFVPDPLAAAPSDDAARFGAELGWQDLQHDLRPQLTLGGQASRFDGAFDERRLQAAIDVFPGRSRASAYAELSFFDEDNPWAAAPQEISAAGVSASFRSDLLELGANFDLQRPERSRWLSTYLPVEWLCVRASAGARCEASALRYHAGAHAGLLFPSTAIRVGGTWSTTREVMAEQLGAFVSGSFLDLLGTLRADASLMLNDGSLMRTFAIGLGAGADVFDGVVDVSGHYRPAWNSYVAEPDVFLEHTVGGSVRVFGAAELALQFDADAVLGRDVDLILLQTLVTFRP